VRDGELVVAVESERFRRIKHWAGFPTVAIQKALDVAGIKGSDIDAVAIGRKPSAHFARKAWYAMRFLPRRAILDRAKNAAHVANVNDAVNEALGKNNTSPKIHLVEHHMAHLASAYHVSPFDEAAIASIDGMGDFVSTMTATGKGTHI
jgi:carbamoyltransferase